jgi:putative endonuclease
MKLYYVYVLGCSDNSYYVGVTNDIYRRFSEHNFSDDKKSYTYTRRPVKLLFHQEFKDINEAISFEKKLKGWSRLKKEAVINGEWQKLPELSKCYNNTRYDR